MRSPSLIVTRFDMEGAILQYRSCRVGFTHYVIGQLLQIANDFYNLQLQVTVVGEEVLGDINCISYRLDFDNRDFFQDFQRQKVDFSRPSLPNTSLHVILQLFPCGLVMDSRLRVRVAGDRIHQLLGPRLIGSPFLEYFSIRRPVMQFSWKEVLMHDRVAWEVVARIKPTSSTSTCPSSPPGTPTPPDGGADASQPGAGSSINGPGKNWGSTLGSTTPTIANGTPGYSGYVNSFPCAGIGEDKKLAAAMAAMCPFSADVSGQNSLRTDSDGSGVSLQRRRSHRSEWIHKNRSLSGDTNLQEGEKGLLLKGQMYILKDHQMAMFLCMPLINNQQEMRDLGLYLNDLSMHDLSREMALTDWQHCSTIELMYNRAEENSAKLEETLNLREQWKDRGDNLLYAMLPRQVAEVLRQGQHPLDTCQSFEEVSVLFAEASLIEERKNLEALEIVRSVNVMYNLLDDLTDRYSVFKVETVGGVYMVVGGVPEPLSDHTAHVAALALHMIRAVADSPRRTHNIRIGIHVGPVVAGVVGNRLPRYCLFGDTVNTASRMLTNCHFGRIHVTERYAIAVEAVGFRTRHRGTLPIKGKGQMNTYWLEGHKEDNAAKKD